MEGFRHARMLIDLPPSVHAPAEARRATDRHLAGLPSVVREDAVLVVSELVSNSVLHANPARPIRLMVESVTDRVRIEVEDGGPGPSPADREGRPGSGGLGLHIVARISDRWGAREPGLVWAELRIPRSGGAGPRPARMAHSLAASR
jgi:signal transduction histidine kinase